MPKAKKTVSRKFRIGSRKNAHSAVGMTTEELQKRIGGRYGHNAQHVLAARGV